MTQTPNGQRKLPVCPAPGAERFANATTPFPFLVASNPRMLVLGYHTSTKRFADPKLRTESQDLMVIDMVVW